MFVVTLPLSASKNPALFARRAKKAGAQLLEIRGDLTPRVSLFRSTLPILLALRGAEKALAEKLKPEFLDVELEEASQFRNWGAAPQLRSGGSSCKHTLIISHHDYKKTPSLTELEKIVQKMYSYKPWMIKIVTFVRDEKDLLVLQKLQEFMNKKSIRSTVLGMGPKAHLTRLLSPTRNAFTYTYLDGALPAAVGQLPLSLYQLLPKVSKPALFGIIGGSQISRSLSPIIHNALFARHKIDAVYSCFPTDDFRKTLKSLFPLSFRGCSVTAPFKLDALKFGTNVDSLSKKIGAANTLVFSLAARREVKAFNTDYFGILKGYPFLSRCHSIAILGAGGAVPAIIEALLSLNSKASVTLFVRDPKKAQTALRHCRVAIRSLSDLRFTEPHAILCAISQDVDTALPKAKKGAVAIDLRYGTETKFMKSARKKGYKVYDGIPMLIHQALRQFEYFTSKKTCSDDVLYLQKILKKNFPLSTFHLPLSTLHFPHGQ